MIPSPPSAAALRDFPRTVVHDGQPLVRIHSTTRAPAYFNAEPTYRFNPPVGTTSFGTCYVSDSLGGAFCESFGHLRLISTSDLAVRSVSKLALDRSAEFADMTDRTILGRFGLDAQISAGGPDVYPRCQEWAAALHATGFAGVRYYARHDPSLELVSYAVFGEPGEQDKPLTILETSELADEPGIEMIAHTFGYLIVPPML